MGGKGGMGGTGGIGGDGSQPILLILQERDRDSFHFYIIRPKPCEPVRETPSVLAHATSRKYDTDYIPKRFHKPTISGHGHERCSIDYLEY